jgi:hypothetical protein
MRKENLMCQMVQLGRKLLQVPSQLKVFCQEKEVPQITMVCRQVQMLKTLRERKEMHTAPFLGPCQVRLPMQTYENLRP